LGSAVLVDRGTVVVLGMVVIRVAVNVCRGHQPGTGNNCQPDQDRNEAAHKRSVCNYADIVKQRQVPSGGAAQSL
jgi:hypothetical protein